MAKKDKNKNKSIQKPQPNGKGEMIADAAGLSKHEASQNEEENDELPLNMDGSDNSFQNDIDENDNQDKGVSTEDDPQKNEGPSVLCKIGYVFLPYKKKFDLLTVDFQTLQTNFTNLEKQYKEDKYQLESKVRIHEGTIKTLSSDKAIKEDENTSLRATLRAEQESNKLLNKDKQHLQEQLKTAQNDLQNIKGSLEEANSKIRSLNNLKDDLRKKEEELRRKSDELRKKEEELRRKSDELKKKEEELQMKDEKITSLSSDIATLELEKNALNRKLKENDDKIVNLRDEKVSLREKFKEDLEKIKSLNPAAFDILSIQSELDKLKESHAAEIKAHEQSLQAGFKKTIADYEQKIQEYKEALATQANTLRANFNKEKESALATAVEAAERPLKYALEDLNAKLKKAQDDNQQIRINAKQRIEDLKAKYSDEINAKTEEYKQGLKAQHEADRAKHEIAVRDLTDKFEKELTKAASLLETKMSAAEATLKAEKAAAKQKLEEKDAEIAKVKTKAEEEKVKLAEDKKAEQERANRLYSRLEGQLKWILNGIVSDLKEAWPEGREGAAGVIVDDILSQNDMITLNEYVSDFVEPALEGVKDKSEDELDEALNKVYRELLSPKRPTWLDSLLRLDALVRVPFIASQFSNEGLDVQKVQRAADKANALLAFNGITVDVPKLFSDIFDRDLHEAQPIKDISSQVDDVASHVKDPETLIDIFTIGYHSADGKLSRRPAVSRLNA